MEKNQFIMIGIAAALVIAVAAPFIASGNPDGLESAFFSIHGAKDFRGSELDEDAAEAAEEKVVAITGNDFAFEAPLPDYSIAGMDKPGEVLAVLIGTFLMVILAYGVARATARPDN